MLAVLNTNTITFVPLIVAFKAMLISNTLVMTDFAIDHANNGVNDDDIVIVNANNATDHTDNALGDTKNGCRQPKKTCKDNFTDTDVVMIQSIVNMIRSSVSMI